MHLNKNCQRIYNILEDKAWHCPREWNFADGHCRRFTDLKQKGFVIESKVCECGRHESKVLARRLVATPQDYVKPEVESDVVREFREEYENRTKVKQLNQVGGLW